MLWGAWGAQKDLGVILTTMVGHRRRTCVGDTVGNGASKVDVGGLER